MDKFEVMFRSAICAILVLLFSVTNAAGNAGDSCASVLNAGVYNTVARSESENAYTEAHQAACADYEDFTYE